MNKEEILEEKKISEKGKEQDENLTGPSLTEEMDKGEDSDKNEDNPKEEDMENKYLRLMADFQNFRKRQEKEKADIYSYANEKIVKELLGVIDNFERALDAFDQADGQENFREGMSLILKQLWDVLEKSGVEEIKALGEEFDPNFHNAVMMEETEEHEPGMVTTVLQKGYILNGKVVRPSMVKVAQ